MFRARKKMPAMLGEEREQWGNEGCADILQATRDWVEILITVRGSLEGWMKTERLSLKLG